ncbi:RuvC-like Holliday junction resolvase [Chloriridovirus anopheles1]|uniref:RuvC-like Holliday junction resolvase n=1 Tax=Chloriridovirus anopheles1 TaxID=1465751 RepID=W8QE71_9VIRU|nr:RuvC-like Holliday junction resolvase [Anopheles minimus iridovirus]AHL67600.1 RuvC-like Holliday junction resolvase [Anopheles minimus iridovirus]
MIAAFDIGIKNFAFAVYNEGEYILLKNNNLDEEHVTKTELNKHKKTDLAEIMKTLKIECEPKMNKNKMVDLIQKKKGKIKKKDVGISLFGVMDDYKDVWEKCDVFLIERQMMVNRSALKLSHFLEAYLKMHFAEKKILNYSASCKTKKLGAERLKSKAERKKWTIQFVSHLLTGDNLKMFQSLPKKDDIADVVCMIESYK